MSDFDPDLRMSARTKAAESAADWVHQWEICEGSIVTGYVLIVESVRPDGTQDCSWMTGSGGPPDEHNRERLSRWRVEGLAREVIRDINTNHVSDE